MSASRPLAVLSDTSVLALPSVEEALRAEGLVLVRASTLDDVFTLLREEPVEWLLLDGTESLALIEAVLPTVQQQREERFFPLLVVIGAANAPERVRLLEQGAEAVVPDGAELERELLLRVRRLGAQRRRGRTSARGGHDVGGREMGGRDARVIHDWSVLLERLDETFLRAQRYDEPFCVASLELRLVPARDAGPLSEAELASLHTELGARLSEILRETDACGLLQAGRYGVLLPRTPLAGALTLAERIVRHIGAQRIGPERAFLAEARVGISGYPQRSVNSARVLLATSEQALLHLRTDDRRRISVAHEVVRSDAH